MKHKTRTTDDRRPCNTHSQLTARFRLTIGTDDLWLNHGVKVKLCSWNQIQLSKWSMKLPTLRTFRSSLPNQRIEKINKSVMRLWILFYMVPQIPHSRSKIGLHLSRGGIQLGIKRHHTWNSFPHRIPRSNMNIRELFKAYTKLLQHV